MPMAKSGQYCRGEQKWGRCGRQREKPGSRMCGARIRLQLHGVGGSGHPLNLWETVYLQPQGRNLGLLAPGPGHLLMHYHKQKLKASPQDQQCGVQMGGGIVINAFPPGRLLI